MLSCTEIKKQWGLPSLRAEQDPEKEKMKRIPLQEIPFNKQRLDRDVGSGRKRKLPVETKKCFSSKPNQEPSFSHNDFSKLQNDLENKISFHFHF